MICNLMLSCGIVTMDCGSALDHGGLAARTSLWLAYTRLAMIRYYIIKQQSKL